MDIALINKIQQQFVGGQWPQFLNSVAISGLRGWAGAKVDFHYPVTAIVGENGSGKSTLLKAAASAYDGRDTKTTFYPSDFFIKTQWDSVTDVSLDYEIHQGTENITYSIKKPTERWSYPDSKCTREVFFLDISRTLPMDATIGYANIAKAGRAEVQSSELDNKHRKSLSHILGRDYSSARFARSDADPDRDVGLLNFGQGEISQFHQGAGEDATLDLMKAFQSFPNNALVIIDEIENSLHPKAQRRLMRSVMDTARLSRIQFIVSTHSPYILEELPSQARILLIKSDGKVEPVYNVSSEFAMSRVDEADHPEIYVLVEDYQAKVLLREILVSSLDGRNVLQRIDILPVGATNILRAIAPPLSEGKLAFRGICYLDGDETPFAGCFVLPGNDAPEKVVFNDLQKNGWPDLDQDLSHGAGELNAWLDEAILLPDHHRWTTHVGDKLKMSKDRVWGVLCKRWVATSLSETDRDAVIQNLQDKLDDNATLFTASH